MRLRIPIHSAILFACAFAVPGCSQGVSADEARRLVERYDRAVCEAYRRCDVRLIDSVVGPDTLDGKRLTGLIGVRLDMGISLDAEMMSLEITGVERNGDELHVRTKEQWHYRDRKIGSGAPVGEESTDSYEMLYVFKKFDGAWMVSETKFRETPLVGRKTTPWEAGHEVLHGIGETPSGKGKSSP